MTSETVSDTDTQNQVIEKHANVEHTTSEIIPETIEDPQDITHLVSLPTPDTENPPLIYHPELSSNYLPIIQPLDTFDWSYRNDPIHKELMQDLFLSSSEDSYEETDNAVQLAVNHLESLRTRRGNSKA